MNDMWARRGRLLVVCFALGFSYVGYRWGLPNARRLDLIFEDQREKNLAEIARATARHGYRTNLHVHDREKNPADAPYFAGVRRLSMADTPDEVLRIQRHYLFWSETGDVSTVFGPIGSMRPHEWDFNPHSFQYGGGILYPIAALIKAADLAGWVRAAGDIQVHIQDPENFARMAWVGRAFGAGMAVLSALFLMRAGALWRGAGTGLAAALLFLLMPGTISMTREMKPHAVGAAWVVLSFYGALSYLRDQRPRGLLISAAAAGLAAGTALNYGVSGLFPGLALLLRPRSVTPRRVAGLLLVPLLFFAASNPYFFLSLDIVRSEAAYHKSVYFDSALAPWWTGLRDLFFQGLSWPVGLWFLASAFSWLRRRGDAAEKLLIFLPPLAYLLILAVYSRGVFPVRVTLFVLPFAALVSARGLMDLLEKKRPWSRIAAGALAGVVAWSGLTWARHYSLSERGRDSLHRAGEWLNQLPAQTSLGCWGIPVPGSFPPVAFSRYALVTIPIEKKGTPIAREDLPDYFVTRTPVPPASEAYVLAQTFDLQVPGERLLRGPKITGPAQPVYVFKKVLK